MELAMDFTRLSHSSDGLSLTIPTMPGILGLRDKDQSRKNNHEALGVVRKRTPLFLSNSLICRKVCLGSVGVLSRQLYTASHALQP
jgi:hypothetical protein